MSHTGLSANPELAPTATRARRVTHLLLASVALVCPVEIPSAALDVVWRKWRVLGMCRELSDSLPFLQPHLPRPGEIPFSLVPRQGPGKGLPHRGEEG